MGLKLMALYDEANALGGIAAKVKLAMLTKMGSAQAEVLPDTAEAVDEFTRALVSIRTEFASRKGTERLSAEGVQRYSTAYTKLMDSHRALVADPAAAYRTITETAATALDVERASVWFYDGARSLIRCVDLYSRKSKDHASGVELMAKDFGVYFQHLQTERTIAAHDARTDPRTSGFTEVYLKPLNIFAMLDVPIWVGGRMQGVLCHEHTGAVRTWRPEEEEFGYRVASVVALVAGAAR